MVAVVPSELFSVCKCFGLPLNLFTMLVRFWILYSVSFASSAASFACLSCLCFGSHLSVLVQTKRAGLKSKRGLVIYDVTKRNDIFGAHVRCNKFWRSSEAVLRDTRPFLSVFR